MEEPFEIGYPSLRGKSGEYYLRVKDWTKNADSKVFLYHLEDGDNRVYSATSKKSFKTGDFVRCIVTVVRTPYGVNYSAAITKHQTLPERPKKVSSAEKQKSEGELNRIVVKDNPADSFRIASEVVSPVGTLHNYSSNYNSYGHERKALEIFDKMREFGYHKCGKSFICSCCGESYEKNQGIKCDTRELYLCNRCRGGQRKKERTSNSLHAISIPMGNKR